MENQLSSNGFFHRTYIIGNSSNDPEWFARAEYWTSTVWSELFLMSMFNDFDWTRKEMYFSNAEKVKMHAKRFSQGHWTFLGLGNEKKWSGECNSKLEGKWNSIASQMVQRFRETCHPVFTSASALSRGILRKLKGKPYISMRIPRTQGSYSRTNLGGSHKRLIHPSLPWPLLFRRGTRQLFKSWVGDLKLIFEAFFLYFLKIIFFVFVVFFFFANFAYFSWFYSFFHVCGFFSEQGPGVWPT